MGRQRFIDALTLDKTKSVLEIGVGTGRLAARVIPLCKSFTGIDISPKTVQRAQKNLSEHKNVSLVCGDFMMHEFSERFDVIYSSLTFMHIKAKDKQAALDKVRSLLSDGGLFVLSIDKNRSEYIDMGTRRLKIYPDTPENIQYCASAAHLSVSDEYETELAFVFVFKK